MDGGETTGSQRRDDLGKGKRSKKKKTKGATGWLRKLGGFLVCASSSQVDHDEERRRGRPRQSPGKDSNSSSSSCFPWLSTARRIEETEEEQNCKEKETVNGHGSVGDTAAAERRSMKAQMISSVLTEAVTPTFVQKLFCKDYRVSRHQRAFEAPNKAHFRPKDSCSPIGHTSSPIVKDSLKPDPLVNENRPKPRISSNPMDPDNHIPEPVSTSKNQKQTNPTAAPPVGSSRTNDRNTRRESRQGSTTASTAKSSLSGLMVVMAMLWMLLLGGRVVAVIFTCLLFYLLPLIKPLTLPRGDGRGENKSVIEIDYNSKEYKKKVIMEGLLERNGRQRTPTVSFA